MFNYSSMLKDRLFLSCTSFPMNSFFTFCCRTRIMAVLISIFPGYSLILSHLNSIRRGTVLLPSGIWPTSALLSGPAIPNKSSSSRKALGSLRSAWGRVSGWVCSSAATPTCKTTSVSKNGSKKASFRSSSSSETPNSQSCLNTTT